MQHQELMKIVYQKQPESNLYPPWLAVEHY